MTAHLQVPWDRGESPSLPGPETLPERADVVVIGGGLAGMTITAMLAARGTDVLLLERGADVGRGASGRHLGHVSTGLIEHPYRLVHAMGAERARALLRFSQENHEILAAWTSFVPSGGLWCALDEREQPQIAMSIDALMELGIPVEGLTAAEVNARAGGVGLGSDLAARPGGGGVGGAGDHAAARGALRGDL